MARTKNSSRRSHACGLVVRACLLLQRGSGVCSIGMMQVVSDVEEGLRYRRREHMSSPSGATVAEK